MAGYLPWYGKKRERLAEHEAAFVALLHSGAARAALIEAAETIRLAQVAALKSKRSQLKPDEKNAIAYEHLEGEIEFWLAMAIEQIIEGYQTEKLKGHRSTAVKQGRE